MSTGRPSALLRYADLGLLALALPIFLVAGLPMLGYAVAAAAWLAQHAILLVGLLGEREDGLAAAVLTFALVTLHLGSLAVAKLVHPEGERA